MPFGGKLEVIASATRAVNVARFMIEQGMGSERISAAGYADTMPVAANSDADGRAHNRRIEIVLIRIENA